MIQRPMFGLSESLESLTIDNDIDQLPMTNTPPYAHSLLPSPKDQAYF